jgi:hypothetical protein
MALKGKKREIGNIAMQTRGPSDDSSQQMIDHDVCCNAIGRIRMFGSEGVPDRPRLTRPPNKASTVLFSNVSVVQPAKRQTHVPARATASSMAAKSAGSLSPRMFADRPLPCNQRWR